MVDSVVTTVKDLEKVGRGRWEEIGIRTLRGIKDAESRLHWPILG
jgi:hypothetical protein